MNKDGLMDADKISLKYLNYTKPLNILNKTILYLDIASIKNDRDREEILSLVNHKDKLKELNTKLALAEASGKSTTDIIYKAYITIYTKTGIIDENINIIGIVPKQRLAIPISKVTIRDKTIKVTDMLDKLFISDNNMNNKYIFKNTDIDILTSYPFNAITDSKATKEEMDECIEYVLNIENLSDIQKEVIKGALLFNDCTKGLDIIENIAKLSKNVMDMHNHFTSTLDVLSCSFHFKILEELFESSNKYKARKNRYSIEEASDDILICKSVISFFNSVPITSKPDIIKKFKLITKELDNKELLENFATKDENNEGTTKIGVIALSSKDDDGSEYLSIDSKLDNIKVFVCNKEDMNNLSYYNKEVTFHIDSNIIDILNTKAINSWLNYYDIKTNIT